MPLPPDEAENGENTVSEEPKLQFSYVECLLFGFHQLGKKLPDFLLDKVDAEQLKDFKIRWAVLPCWLPWFLSHNVLMFIYIKPK